MVNNRLGEAVYMSLGLGMLLACLATVPSVSRAAEDAGEATARVLVVTGEDYPGHRWRETAPALMAELSKDQRLRVDVLSDLESLASTRLTDYETVVVHFKNYDPAVPGRKGLENLATYVKGGGGLVPLHFACGAFEEFKDHFESIAGRVWFGMKPPPGRRQHDPRGSFTVNITEAKHPITDGMQDFQTVDELYTCLEGDEPITTLATAVSKMDGKTYPIAFVLSSGQGRVFHCVLGHDVEAFTSKGAAELIRRGTAWTAGLKPAAAKR